MKECELRKRVDDLSPWYHSITLPYGIVTPGQFSGSGWDMTRKVRDRLNYKGKSVLDLASFDGMWAFEAEELGASFVMATDCNWRAYHHFLLCHQARESKVFPFYNVPMHELVRRLDSFIKGCNVKWHGDDKIPLVAQTKFDIVQHLGLFYHLRDPLFSLLQSRSLLNTGGYLLLETACCWSKESVMLFNQTASGFRYYNDSTSWWAPSVHCIKDILLASLFEIIEDSISTIGTSDLVGRVALVAKAIDPKPGGLIDELRNTYRTPGFEL